MARYVIGLIGNQNSGKSTLFNALTGSNQKVGNFPGVTVERKEGYLRKHRDITIVDLPGIYSLSPYTKEEVVTRQFLMKDKPDAIINIIDATNIERSLYLTLQLIELQIPMILAINMIDELALNGSKIDRVELERLLGIETSLISAMRKTGIEDLIDRVARLAVSRRLPKQNDFCVGEIHRAIHAITHLIEPTAIALGYSPRFIAIKLVEGDALIKEELALHQQDWDIIDRIIKDMEFHVGMDHEAAMADMRYTFIEGVVQAVISGRRGNRQQAMTQRLDKILTHRYFAIPIFLSFMGLTFYLTFGPIGSTLQRLLEQLLNSLLAYFSDWLVHIGTSSWLHDLLIHGVLKGISSILSFVPIILVLFFFLSLMEDSGYMARVAYVMDKLLQKLGLSGKSLIPVIVGFGCTVPAVISTRTLASERDRKLTIALLPFISCTAKLPIYALFVSAFFWEQRAVVMMALYLLGIGMAIATALFFKNTVYKGDGTPFVLELPPYRLPSWNNIGRQMWEKAKDFIERAFTVVFLCSMLIWLLSHISWSLQFTKIHSISLLAVLSRTLTPLFAPLGFGDWRIVSALISGLTAKEAVVGTLSVLVNANGKGMLTAALTQLFTPVGAMSFLIFTLLYTPCFAAIAAIRRELNSIKDTLMILIYQLAVAWLVSFVFYQTASLIWR